VGRVVFTRRAHADLDDIWLHVALDNAADADRLIDRIFVRCQRLADYPGLGLARPEIGPDARVLVVGDYLVLYRVDGIDAVVVRVTHGARRLQGLFDVGSDD
jgi:toxin ParE1/3/4